MIRDFTIQDHEAAVALWETSAQIGLSSADDWTEIKRFLDRNPGMSQVAVEGGRIVATILCGYDGRRGYLHHLFVEPDYRRRGFGRKLVETCLDRLEKEGIHKCHLLMFHDNDAGREFWRNTGWQERLDISVFSKNIRNFKMGR
jgi:ribosomal protein S18 acetylase RimI-like enzyme